MLFEIQDWLPWKGRRWAFTFRALQSRNFRRFFCANSFSLFGTWMQRMATSWIVYRLTGSAILLGTIDFASQFSAFLLMPISGVFLDRFSLKKSLVITQSLGAAQAFLLAFLAYSDVITFSHLIILSVFLGAINAFDMPGRQSLAVHLVDRKEDLGNAIALNSSLFNSARLIGPSLAGLLVYHFGEAVCFFFNAVSFLPVVYVLATMEVPNNLATPVSTSFKSGFLEGVFYAFRHSVIGPIIILLAVASFIGMSFLVLLPIFAKEILGGGPDTLGFLMGATGVGALAGALFLAARRDVSALHWLLPACFAFFGLWITCFAWSTNIYFALLFLIFTGFCMTTGWASANTILQTLVDDDKRARVMSLYMMTFMGMSPLGSLLMGYLSTHIGPQRTVTISGIFCCAAATIFFVFQRRGASSVPKSLPLSVV